MSSTRSSTRLKGLAAQQSSSTLSTPKRDLPAEESLSTRKSTRQRGLPRKGQVIQATIGTKRLPADLDREEPKRPRESQASSSSRPDDSQGSSDGSSYPTKDLEPSSSMPYEETQGSSEDQTRRQPEPLEEGPSNPQPGAVPFPSNVVGLPPPGVFQQAAAAVVGYTGQNTPFAGDMGQITQVAAERTQVAAERTPVAAGMTPFAAGMTPVSGEREQAPSFGGRGQQPGYKLQTPPSRVVPATPQTPQGSVNTEVQTRAGEIVPYIRETRTEQEPPAEERPQIVPISGRRRSLTPAEALLLQMALQQQRLMQGLENRETRAQTEQEILERLDTISQDLKPKKSSFSKQLGTIILEASKHPFLSPLYSLGTLYISLLLMGFDSDTAITIMKGLVFGPYVAPLLQYAWQWIPFGRKGGGGGRRDDGRGDDDGKGGGGGGGGGGKGPFTQIQNNWLKLVRLMTPETRARIDQLNQELAQNMGGQEIADTPQANAQLLNAIRNTTAYLEGQMGLPRPVAPGIATEAETVQQALTAVTEAVARTMPLEDRRAEEQVLEQFRRLQLQEARPQQKEQQRPQVLARPARSYAAQVTTTAPLPGVGFYLNPTDPQLAAPRELQDLLRQVTRDAGGQIQEQAQQIRLQREQLYRARLESQQRLREYNQQLGQQRKELQKALKEQAKAQSEQETAAATEEALLAEERQRQIEEQIVQEMEQERQIDKQLTQLEEEQAKERRWAQDQQFLRQLERLQRGGLESQQRLREYNQQRRQAQLEEEEAKERRRIQDQELGRELERLQLFQEYDDQRIQNLQTLGWPSHQSEAYITSADAARLGNETYAGLHFFLPDGVNMSTPPAKAHTMGAEAAGRGPLATEGFDIVPEDAYQEIPRTVISLLILLVIWFRQRKLFIEESASAEAKQLSPSQYVDKRVYKADSENKQPDMWTRSLLSPNRTLAKPLPQNTPSNSKQQITTSTSALSIRSNTDEERQVYAFNPVPESDTDEERQVYPFNPVPESDTDEERQVYPFNPVPESETEEERQVYPFNPVPDSDTDEERQVYPFNPVPDSDTEEERQVYPFNPVPDSDTDENE